uniref:HECT-type E3 ubiquitin transferase n=1 Tax=Culex tarsalis TaxID=7177 RepID=A0A1Q3FUI0_CULTA
MSTLHFVVHPLPGTEDQLNDRIREVADKINKYGVQILPALQSLKVPVKQIVVGPAHLGILLEDGRAFRVAFSIIPERLDLSKQDPNKASGSGGTGGGTGTGGGSQSNNNSKNSPASRQCRSRARIMRTSNSVRGGSSSQGSGSRSTGVIMGGGGSAGSRSLVSVPAPFVPEELVTQAQVVLQGKSRNLIIRELQRTNLDVNLAVNNLLSRDDEGGDDTEEGSDNYVAEDLISLLDGGFHADNSVIIDAEAMFSEDMFGFSNIRNLMLYSRARSERTQNSSSSSSAAAASASAAAVGAGAGGGTAGSGSSAGAGSSSGGGSGSGAAGSGAAGSAAAGSNDSGRQQQATGASGSAVGNGAGASGLPVGSSGTGGSSGGGSGGGSGLNSAEREGFGRWRDRQYFGPRRWFQSGREDAWDKESDPKKKEFASGYPLWVSDELEAWPEKDQAVRFVEIASLYSEFIGVTSKGELHQWRWADVEPYRSSESTNIFHPKTVPLNLLYEKVMHISATSIRCSVSTESGRIATWMDELLGYAGSKLEHVATSYPEFALDKIVSLHTCTLYTVARTESGELFWWGVLPFGQRKRLWDKYKAKAKKPVRPSVNTPEVTVGAQVCMKNSPMYQHGAIGFTISNGVPKVGQLLNAAWDLTNICRFKLLSMSTLSQQLGLASGGASHPNTTGTGILAASSEVKEKVPTSSSGTSSTKQSSGGSKETADRLDMPPPPSPASSTCSDTGSVSNSHKQRKRMAPKDDSDGKKDEEQWLLKDVIFVEDVRSVPIGRVLKVDGDYAAVKFPPLITAGSGGNSGGGGIGGGGGGGSSSKDRFDDTIEAWQDCRLLRKDDLQVIKSATTSRVPDCFQKIPRRIVLNPHLPSGESAGTTQLLTIAVDSKGIHAIMRTGSKLHYCLFNLNTGRQEQDSVFPTDIGSFMGTSPSNVSLTCAGDCSDSVLLLRDGNNTIYPMSKDCVDAIRDPSWLDLPPIKCIAAASLTLPSVGVNLKSQVALVVLAPEQQLLMARILRCDIEGVRHVLGQLEGELKSQLMSVIAEHTDGNRNIIHACISMCSPTSNKDSDHDPLAPGGSGGSGSNTNSGSSSNSAGLECINVITNTMMGNRPVSIREIMRRSVNREIDGSNQISAPLPPGSDEAPGGSLPVVYWPPEYDPASGDEDSMSGLNAPQKSVNETYISDPNERRANALQIVQLLCESPVLQPYLRQLLSAKDAQGQTPFMLAVTCRAYQAGIIVFNAILKIASGDAAIRDSMIFPAGSAPDQSPLGILCCNDTCSFTWTGADHINQDIFECRTCGLTGSLCCCTECAKVCHKGHDCKLKRTSPTAYCDCWEKCKCKALIAGNQTKRFELLCKMATDTDLVTKFNSRGESILLFLIQTVGRQMVEQRQYRATSRVRNSSGNARKTPSLEADSDMPEHDLEPPRFARKALDRLLNDWPAVRSMIMTGAEQEKPIVPNAAQPFYDDDNQQVYLQSQSGTTLLDKFTHSLIVRCSNDPLEKLLVTLVNELQNETIPGRIDEAQKVARRFVRSVARVFVIFSIERFHNPEKSRNSTTQAKHLQAYRRVFTTLFKFAIEELIEISDALITPVRLGVVKPTAPFSLSSSSIDSTDDLFSVEPLAPPANRGAVNIADMATGSSRGGGEGIETERSANSGFMSRINLRLRDIEDNNDNDAMAQDDGENSEPEEMSEREPAPPRRSSGGVRTVSSAATLNAGEEESQDPLRNEEAAQGESDTEFNFHEAETESDSDDNQSTQDAQRSVQTGATAGSDTDDSGDSSQPDDEGSEDGESDDHSHEDFNLGDEQLERRQTSGGNQRTNLAPQSMQWAIRSRETVGPERVRLTTGGSNLVFIDPNALRRTTAASAAVTAAQQQEAPTMTTTASALARAFGIVLRQISDLIGMLPTSFTGASSALDVTHQEAIQLQMYVEKRLKPTWDWILTVMEATEAQLRFGASLTDSTDPTHPLHPLNTPSASTSSSTSTPTSVMGVLAGSRNRTAIGSLGATTARSLGFTDSSATERSTRDGSSSSDAASSRRDFLTYCLSLMRAHNSEHRDFLPVLDVTELRHVAYVLDAILFYMRASNDCDIDRTTTGSNVWDDQDENENEDAEEDISTSIVMDTDSVDGDDLMRPSLGRRHSFFQRSDSTLCLGCPAPDPFNAPLAEALPLADQPHLLQPNARREELFGMPKRPITLLPNTQQNPSGGGGGEGNVNLEVPPVRLSLSASIRNDEMAGGSSTSISNSTTSNVESVSMEIFQEDGESSQDKPTGTTTATTTGGVEISIPVSIYQDATKQQLHKTTTIVLNEKGETISPIKEVSTVGSDLAATPEQPKAGPSGEQSQSSKPPPPPPPAVFVSSGGSTTGGGGSGTGYYKKNRLFYIKNSSSNKYNNAEESDDVDVDEISIISSDEPQDLSQSSIKIDVDTDQDHDELSESDSEDSRQIIKRQKLDESAETESAPPTVVVVQQDATSATASSSSSSSAIRPPIIVTRRKTVSIDGGTAAPPPPPPAPQQQAATAAAAAGGSGSDASSAAVVTAQGSSSSCSTVSIGGEQQQQQPGTITSFVTYAATGSGSTSGTSPGKSVIVRAGPSTAFSPSASSSAAEVIQHAEAMDLQEISAHVTVETTPNVQQTVQPELPPRGIYLRSGNGGPGGQGTLSSNILSDILLGRWRLSLILFGRVFLEDVGVEPGSVIYELNGFPVKEAKFRRYMEKLRNAQQKDLTLSKMERNRASLLTQTFKELNTHYNNRRLQSPLAFSRVKVTFKDEPGEGSGVARSFYTSIAEALLANEKLPNLDAAQTGSAKYTTVPFNSKQQRHRRTTASTSGRAAGTATEGPTGATPADGSTRPKRDPNDHQGRATKQPLGRPKTEPKKTINQHPPPEQPATKQAQREAQAHRGNSNPTFRHHKKGTQAHQQQRAERLYPKQQATHPNNPPKITPRQQDLPANQNPIHRATHQNRRKKPNEPPEISPTKKPLEKEKRSVAGAAGGSTVDQSGAGAGSSGYTSGQSSSSKKSGPVLILEDCQLDAPLFYSPGKRGFYSPRQGFPSSERLNAFRNVGRLIGLCLLQNELFPLFLQRHVLKYILGRQVRFHDLAFFDPVVYDSLRQLVKDSQTKSGITILQSLELNFVIDLVPEEGSGTVELVPGGRDIQVNETNVFDYVRKYAEYRMIKTQEKALDSLRSGVFDVLPDTALDQLTAEDLRLLLNGVGDIHVGTLISYTSFNDESNESSDKLLKFKRWLWSVVEKMSNLERQDLVYFWTGSPALPASEEGFQPMPSVTIRPADDAHLPTANTCISRLYIPLYSSKAVLRHKLLLAIKTKNFGFV